MSLATATEAEDSHPITGNADHLDQVLMVNIDITLLAVIMQTSRTVIAIIQAHLLVTKMTNFIDQVLVLISTHSTTRLGRIATPEDGIHTLVFTINLKLLDL